jgi:hypothetical protein
VESGRAEAAKSNRRFYRLNAGSGAIKIPPFLETRRTEG